MREAVSAEKEILLILLVAVEGHAFNALAEFRIRPRCGRSRLFRTDV
jgi:hypothetical protein